MRKKTIIFGAISTAAAIGGVSVFRYFSDMAVARKQPKIPYPVQFFIDRSQDDDLFDPVVAALQEDIKEIPYEILHKITYRITHEVEGINRVLMDLTPKPTGTIEWE